jgi:hypothetical protein
MQLLRIADQVVTYVRVERPSFDLVGLVLGSFKMAGVIIGVAVVLGGLLGLRLIWKRRVETEPHQTSLDLRQS